MQPEVFICGVPHYAYDYITSLYLCQEVFQKYFINFEKTSLDTPKTYRFPLIYSISVMIFVPCFSAALFFELPEVLSFVIK